MHGFQKAFYKISAMQKEKQSHRDVYKQLSINNSSIWKATVNYHNSEDFISLCWLVICLKRQSKIYQTFEEVFNQYF